MQFFVVSDFSLETSNDINVVVEGYIKWDGCSDLDIGRGDSYRNHFCNLSEAMTIGRMLTAIYELGAKTIPRWNVELAT